MTHPGRVPDRGSPGWRTSVPRILDTHYEVLGVLGTGVAGRNCVGSVGIIGGSAQRAKEAHARAL